MFHVVYSQPVAVGDDDEQAAPGFVLDPDERQAMLAERDVAARVQRLIGALALQRQALGIRGDTAS